MGTTLPVSIMLPDPLSQVRGGAASENRTPDNLITSEVLYRLS